MHLVPSASILVALVAVARMGGGAQRVDAPKVASGARTVVRTPVRRDGRACPPGRDDEITTA